MAKRVEPKYLIINDASDTGDFQLFTIQSSVTRSVSQVGEVRRYAGGRYRPVARIGQQKTFQADLPSQGPVQVAWLEAHVGRVMCVRDWTGLKLFAVYFDIVSTGVRGTYNCDISLALTGVTYTEART